MNEYNALERQAALLRLQATQTVTIHTAMFMQLLAAQQAGNEKLAKFYAERFPADVRKAYDAWLAQKPFENPNADPHPFMPNLYEVRAPARPPRQARRPRAPCGKSRSAGNVSDQYLANTMLLATVLFFASGSGKFEQPRVHMAAFGYAAAVLAFAIARAAMFPP